MRATTFERASPPLFICRLIGPNAKPPPAWNRLVKLCDLCMIQDTSQILTAMGYSSSSSSSSSDSEDQREKKRRKSSEKKEIKKRKKDKKEKKEKKEKTHKKEKKHKKQKKDKDNDKNKPSSSAASSMAMPTGEPLFDFQVSRIQQHAAAASPPQQVGEAAARPAENEEGAAPPKKRSMVPMSKAEAEEGQDKITKQWDEDTGRWRWIRGDGEVVERIVSQAEQRAINKQATHWISKEGAKGF